MRHSELVEYAKTWLHRKHFLVITEMVSSAGEIPDAIAWTPYCSTLIECKTSLVDFKNDKHKIHHRFPDKAMGNYRYYFTEKGLIPVELLPEKWGLVERWGRTNRMIKKAEFMKCSEYHEITLLLSSIRRIGQNPPKGISVKCYTYITENKATLGFGNLPRDEKEAQ